MGVAPTNRIRGEQLHRPPDLRPLARFHLVEQREAEKILRRIPEQRLGGRADVAENSELVGDHREVARPPHQRLETSLIRPQGLLGSAPFADSFIGLRHSATPAPRHYRHTSGAQPEDHHHQYRQADLSAPIRIHVRDSGGVGSFFPFAAQRVDTPVQRDQDHLDQAR